MIESDYMLTFEELLETWDGETAVVRRDRESNSWIFICVHSTRLGPAGGGTRMRVYGTSAEALEDAMRLSAGMTRKLAVAGLPFGFRRSQAGRSDALYFSGTAISSRRWVAPIGRART